MRCAAVILELSTSLVGCWLLLMPTTSNKVIGNQYWEVTRYGYFGYRTTERCWGLCGSWAVYGDGRIYPPIEFPPPKEEDFPNQLLTTIMATAYLVGATGLVIWLTTRPGSRRRLTGVP